MEYRATKSGLSREVQNRINEKYNAEEAGKVLKWIRLLTPPSGVPDDLIKAAQEIPEDITSAPAEQFYQYLKSGLVLGYLMASLKPDRVSSLGVNMWKNDAYRIAWHRLKHYLKILPRESEAGYGYAKFGMHIRLASATQRFIIVGVRFDVAATAAVMPSTGNSARRNACQGDAVHYRFLASPGALLTRASPLPRLAAGSGE
ncbi:calponin, putative [Echinococcus granulosus]|uniref:Calponin, putative n=1 Tax=Echinococcus granulosus TaxID=6210 RepID=W6ULB0_ECHGR|nr:calponin, putative [Echinococcus granulosus]EUB58892.1 calponin, putative [Echinococcus granulosus]